MSTIVTFSVSDAKKRDWEGVKEKDWDKLVLKYKQTGYERLFGPFLIAYDIEEYPHKHEEEDDGGREDFEVWKALARRSKRHKNSKGPSKAAPVTDSTIVAGEIEI